MTQVQTPRQRRFFETTLGAFVIAGAALVAIGVLVYLTQFAGGESYGDSRRDAELACADYINLETSELDTTEFDRCVEYEMGR